MERKAAFQVWSSKLQPEKEDRFSQILISVRLEIKNSHLRQELEGILSSVEGVRLQAPDPFLPCDLAILEIESGNAAAFDKIRMLQSSKKVKEIFLTSPHVEPDLLIQVLRVGVKEFFPQPIKREEVIQALLNYRERKGNDPAALETRATGKIINLIGSKGGVGTTTLAVNLATSLVESKGSPSVALIDMNLLFGEIPIFLNIEPSFNWGEVAQNISRADSTYLMSILTKHESGVHVLTSPTGLDFSNAATPEIIEKILEMMRDAFDYIVIDSGQSIDDISLRILEMCDLVLVVGILSLPCLSNLRKLLFTFQRLGFPKSENVRIIINRYHKRSLIDLRDAEESLKEKIFWLIPNDYVTTMAAINQGRAVSSIAYGAEITKNLRGLASSLLEKNERRKIGDGTWLKETS